MRALYIETLSDEFFTLPHEPTHPQPSGAPKKYISIDNNTTQQHQGRK
jgi:hypothetical protein